LQFLIAIKIDTLTKKLIFCIAGCRRVQQGARVDFGAERQGLRGAVVGVADHGQGGALPRALALPRGVRPAEFAQEVQSQKTRGAETAGGRRQSAAVAAGDRRQRQQQRQPQLAQ